MEPFDPIQHIENSTLLLQKDGRWPTFHDAEIHNLNFWRGDIQPDKDRWIAPVLEAMISLFPMWNDNPWMVTFRFHDCDDIAMSGFNHCNMIYGLNFSFVERGTYTDGSPLSPWIFVEFQPVFGIAMNFKCMRVEIIERKEIEEDEYASLKKHIPSN